MPAEQARTEKEQLSAELASAKSDLAEAENFLNILDESMTASDFSCAQVVNHKLAIKEARSSLRSVPGGAEEQTCLFMQTGDVSCSESRSLEVVDVVRRLAKKEHSASLAQLATKIGAVFKFDAGIGEEPSKYGEGLGSLRSASSAWRWTPCESMREGPCESEGRLCNSVFAPVHALTHTFAFGLQTLVIFASIPLSVPS